MYMMFEIFIFITLFGLIAAIFAIIEERKKRKRAEQKWKEFETGYPLKETNNN
jgi:preprotein translocase subunit YajC